MANHVQSVSNELHVSSRLSNRSVNCALVEKITRSFLVEILKIDAFYIEISIVSDSEITRLNEKFLGHIGSTDVLAFDYREVPRKRPIHGEVFVCSDEAAIQAVRFKTTWQSELLRYVIHGILHLSDYDDHDPARRRQMKRQENQALSKLARQFDFTLLDMRRSGLMPKNRGKTK